MTSIAFEPTRAAALSRLSEFLPHAGRDYAGLRNYDLPGHPHVSRLSPYIRRRLITEEEVLEAVLRRFSLSSAEKFVQEVYWRTYWKGWLEMRPVVWTDYQLELAELVEMLECDSDLKARWDMACTGCTGIAGFDDWARELTGTGYLHNHARMWFASIWIFTLKLPWVLGADFFLRHLLDGDPASNTLGWRWVAGVQTRGKTYLARASNISKYTEGRFRPTSRKLASEAPPLDGPPSPPPEALRLSETINPGRKAALLLTDEDLSPGFLFQAGLRPLATGWLSVARGVSPLKVAPGVTRFVDGAFEDVATRYFDRLGPVTPLSVDQVADWFAGTGADHLVTAYAPVGPTAAALERLRLAGLPLREVRRCYDSEAWPSATAGFFKFKEKIAGFSAVRVPRRSA
ncbi:MAG: FAD-binding domain-containing protein [Pseudomonadota bacterium]